MLTKACNPAVFILITFLFICPSFAEEDTIQIPSQVQEAESAHKLKMITAIEVKGNKTISTNTIVSKLKSRIASPYQENIISDDLKRLYLSGFFSDIKIDTEEYKDGLKVIITVAERPIIASISFLGIRRLTMRDEKIKELLKSKETQYLDYPSLTEDINTLKKLYEKIGYTKVGVDYKVDIDEQANKAKVQFNVTEGKKIKVTDILVEGNQHYPRKRILKLMKTKRAWFFNSGVLKDEVLNEDIERVKAFYQRQGFADVKVAYELKYNGAVIIIKIEEGRKYVVGNITIEGNENIPKEDILAALKEAVTQKVFSQEALKEDVVNIHGLYFDRGYIMAVVQETTSFNSYTGRTDITYHIVENEVAYVDKINMRGNIKTKDVVIRRELRIRPGDKFDGQKLKRSKERLQNLGFFEEVGYDIEDTDMTNKKDLIVDVKEAKTGSFSFGGGYSTVEEFVGFAEIEQKNFDWKNFPYFTGAGQDLKLRASFGTITSGFDLSFTEPWLFDYPVSFGFDAYKRSRQRESDIGYGYDEDITGGDLRLGKEVSEYVRADATYRHDVIKITNISDDATSDLKSEDGENTISSMEFGLTYDSRDNVFDSREGDLLSGSLQAAGGPFAGDKDFIKFSGRASHYFPLMRGSALELRGRLGFADAYGDSDKLPIYERYFAGGAYTIRGYHERKIGPVDKKSKDPLGGEAMLIGNAEYLYPLLGFLRLAAFYDVGNVWAKSSDLGAGGFKSGVGIGLRLKTPIGPVVLDYGIPLNKEPEEEDKGSGRFHFSMSRGF